MSPRSPLLPLAKKFFEYDPGAAAHTLESMDEKEAIQVLLNLPANLSAASFGYLQVSHAAALLKELPADLFRDIIERLTAHQAAAIVANFPSELRRSLLEHLSEDTQKRIRELLTYPDNSAGRIMTTEFIAFQRGVKVKDAIHRVRTLVSKNAPVTYAFVVDEDNQLLGLLTMRELMLAQSNATVDDVMRTDVFTVNGFMDREEVANELSHRRYLAAPVVDYERRLLGIVKTDQLIEEVQEEATEDIQKMVGAGGDERAFSPVGFSIRKRLPWLHVNLFTAFLAAAVISMFEGLIAKITVLAVFLPVVAGQGGNAGSQSLAVVIRSLVMREIPRGRAWSLIIKEAWIGLLNGTVIGLVTGAVAWLWNGNPYLGLVIGLAMIVNMIVAGLAGAAIPVALQLAGRDPAQSSGILLTTVTDVVGFFTFLGFALLFQNLLV